MAKTPAIDGLLNTTQAAELAGMSRQALEGHIFAGRIQPTAIVGKVRLFSRLTIQGWLKERQKQGINKRGPQPKNDTKKAGK